MVLKVKQAKEGSPGLVEGREGERIAHHPAVAKQTGGKTTSGCDRNRQEENGGPETTLTSRGGDIGIKKRHKGKRQPERETKGARLLMQNDLIPRHEDDTGIVGGFYLGRSEVSKERSQEAKKPTQVEKVPDQTTVKKKLQLGDRNVSSGSTAV